MSVIATYHLCMTFFALCLLAFSNALTVQKNILSLTQTEDDRNSQQQQQQQQSEKDSRNGPSNWPFWSLLEVKNATEVHRETTRATGSLVLPTSGSSVSQKETITMSTLELPQANVTSESSTDNVTHSFVDRHNTNVTTTSLTGEVSNSTTKWTRTNVTSESPKEKLTNSPVDVPKTSVTSVPQTEQVTRSAIELSNTNVTSASVTEQVANYTLDAFNTNIKFLSQTTNMSNSPSEFAETTATATVQTVNVSTSTTELSETNVTSHSQTENVSTHRASASGAEQVSNTSTKPREQHNQDIEAQHEHNGHKINQQAELLSETRDNHAVDKNTSCADPIQPDNIKHDISNQTVSAQPNINTSSQQIEEHARQLGEEDYDYGIDDTLLNHSSAEPTDRLSEPGCPTCRMRAIDKHYRILQFKNQILSSLQITTIPNVTGVPIPKVPALTHLYEMDVDLMSDPPNGRRHYQKNDDYDDDFVVKTERIFIGAKEAPMALHLNLTDTVYFPPAVHLFTSEIKSAFLWFYIRKHSQPPASVTIDLIVPQAKHGHTFATKKLLSVKLPKQKAHGWKRIDLTTTLSQWIKHPMTNFGLLIKAADNSGNNLIVLPHPPEVDKGYEPCLDIKIIEPRHNSRRRRSESLMCVENSTDTRCCRHPLIVGFAEFGWDWIIAPTHVNADYCTGECRMTMQDNTPYSWVNQQVPGTNSCCTPTKLSPLPLMYFDENMHIVYQILQNMKVDKCGCA